MRLRDIQRATYEAPFTVMCGPLMAALMAGYLVNIGGAFYLTDAGADYLDPHTVPNPQEYTA